MACCVMWPLLLVGAIMGSVRCSRVIELSDRFLEVMQDGIWLIKFYAPWCGHCRNLEPIWNQVAQSLTDVDIHVGRVDCTRFVNVATEFGVKGFPTILFVKGSKRIEYKEDRTKDDIVEFAKRMIGPSIQRVHSCDELEKLRLRHAVFFLLLEDATLQDKPELNDNYSQVAEELQPYSYFYKASIRCHSTVDDDAAITHKPSVYVLKDNTSLRYPGMDDSEKESNITLYEWANKERFPAFLKITHGNFPHLLRSKKHVVIAVLQENQIGHLSLAMKEFKGVVEAIAINNKGIYHEHFVFGWVGQPDIANSVAMATLDIPSLIVVNPITYQYYLPELEETEKVPFPQSIISLLDHIMNDSAIAYGGDTLPYRFYRIYYEATTSVSGMWKGNPVLTALLFGLPLGFLSIICYTSCCSDILETEDEEIEHASRHEKGE